jgi:uncharacterized protein YcbX
MDVAMAHVVALYRYPVKGLTPEPVQAITVLPGGRVAGDRLLNFRFADAPVGDTEWCRKYHGIVLANTPALARLTVAFDERSRRLTLRVGDHTLADEGLDPAGRARLVAALTDYVQSQEENPLRDHPERLPIKLVGDGATPRYQDNERGQVTLHSRASVASAGEAFDDLGHDERRYRHNIVIDGVAPWTEQSWIGGAVRIGDVTFEAIVPKVRCLATHANPQSGERDLPVMQLLAQKFGQKQPTFGIGMLSSAGGEIRIGDRLLPL